MTIKRFLTRQSLSNLTIRAGYQISIWGVLQICEGCQQSSFPKVATSEQAVKSSCDAVSSPDFRSRVQEPHFCEVTDSLGRKVTLTQIPRRIVSLSPKNTEMLFAVGAGNQTIGSTKFCNYPPAALEMEKVGGFSAKSLSIERIVSLKPDLVVSVSELHMPIVQELERLEIPVIALSTESLHRLFEDLQLIGHITGHGDDASLLINQLSNRLDRIRKTAQTIPAHERLTVLYYIWGEPLTVAGPNSFFGEMLQICGAINIVEDKTNRFPKLTTEFLLAQNPDVIIASTNHSDLGSVADIESRTGWNALKAVQTKRVYILDGNLLSRCGPRTVDAMELMAHTLYPRYFSAPDSQFISCGEGGQEP